MILSDLLNKELTVLRQAESKLRQFYIDDEELKLRVVLYDVVHKHLNELSNLISSVEAIIKTEVSASKQSFYNTEISILSARLKDHTVSPTYVYNYINMLQDLYFLDVKHGVVVVVTKSSPTAKSDIEVKFDRILCEAKAQMPNE